MIINVPQKIEGNENSPDYLNIIVNYHYHGEQGNYLVIHIYGQQEHAES